MNVDDFLKRAVNRRQFLGSSAKNAAGVAAGMVALAGATAVAGSKSTPGERVRVATIGVRNQGKTLTAHLAGLPDVDVVALCDVDESLRPAATSAATDAHGKSPRWESDFRRILDDPTIDAVVIATPDHWHAPMTILACQAGKDVYVEKPVSHNVREGQQMVAAARRSGRVVQSGFATAKRHTLPVGRRFRPQWKAGCRSSCQSMDGPSPQTDRSQAGQRSTGRRRLRSVARPGPAACVQRQPLPLQLALVLGLRNRRTGQLGHRTCSTSPAGVSASACRHGSRPRAVVFISTTTRKRPIRSSCSMPTRGPRSCGSTACGARTGWKAVVPRRPSTARPERLSSTEAGWKVYDLAETIASDSSEQADRPFAELHRLHQEPFASRRRHRNGPRFERAVPSRQHRLSRGPRGDLLSRGGDLWHRSRSQPVALARVPFALGLAERRLSEAPDDVSAAERRARCHPSFCFSRDSQRA